MATRFTNNRWLAHCYLFPHRHQDESSEAHEALVKAIYSSSPRQLIEGFRGLGKSTYLEEAAVLKACLREFHNLVIVGSSYTRACERLSAIKREIVVNRQVQDIFGDIRGGVWQEGKIELKGGICIQALGREQSLLGIKHHDFRPDAALVDDVEDADEVRTDAERAQTWDWFLKAFLPSLDHPMRSWVRVLGTRRGSGSLPERLEKQGFPSLKLPLTRRDDDGSTISTWPAKFPLDEIQRLQELYKGDMQTFMQEYMCEPTSEGDRIFDRSMFRFASQSPSHSPTWQATYAMIDPARTTNRSSALTGWAVWSWTVGRLTVWAAGAESLKPDEIIELCFRIADQFHPTWIGIEEDGLNEWVRQPLRHEQQKRNQLIPIRAVRAPRNKLAFIGGLQQYYQAGEVIHAQALPELEAQLLSFPHGKIDAANALAYALTMRPAGPVYEGFQTQHIADLFPIVNRPLYLAANATRTMLTAALCQSVDGQIRILMDWVIEGTPEDNAANLHAEAGLWQDSVEREVPSHSRRDFAELLKIPERRFEFSRLPLEWVTPQSHRDRWHNQGLLQAIQRIPAKSRCGSTLEAGRREIASRLNSHIRGRPALLVSTCAEWTLRGFAGGYTRALPAKGVSANPEAEPGPYRLLMEGLESFCGSLQPDEEDTDIRGNMALDKRGRPYLSAMPQR